MVATASHTNLNIISDFPNVSCKQSLPFTLSPSPKIIPTKDPESNSDAKRLHRRITSPNQLAFETIRLSTFDTWAVPFVGKEELAKAGLFYLRSKDLVQCFFCKGVIGYWEEGDEPFKEHRKHFPRCPFVRGDYTSNVPKEAGGSDAASSVLNKFLEKSLKNGKVPPKPNRIETDSSSSKKLSYSMFKTLPQRMASFIGWPTDNAPSLQTMAQAGFLYSGISDVSFCQRCGGGLFNWQKEDDPKEDHGTFYPRCPNSRSAEDERGSPSSGDLQEHLKISDQEADLIMKQHPIAKKLINSGLCPMLVKYGLKDYLERYTHLPLSFLASLEAVSEWEEMQRKIEK